MPGWGGTAEGLSYVMTTHEFFTTCRGLTESTCTLVYITINAVMVVR